MCGTDQSTKDLGLTDKNDGCACGTNSHSTTQTDSHTEGHAHSHGAAADHAAEGAIQEHYLVEGMSCGHCVASVTEEVSAVDGVTNVSVDLNAGGASRVMVVSSKPIQVDAIRSAVTEAGYSLVTA
jgi:copper chaperone